MSSQQQSINRTHYKQRTLTCKTFNVKVTSGKNSFSFVIIPGGIRYRVSHLNISTVFPLDVTIRIVKNCSTKVFSFSVLLEGCLGMTKGEWLLDLEVLNVECVVGGVASSK